MKTAKLAGLVLVLVLMAGCPLDGLFGITEKPDGTVDADPKGGPVGTIGGVLTAFGGPAGLAGLAVSLVGNLYQSIRKRQYVAALVSTVTAVEAFTQTPEGKILADSKLGTTVGKVLKTTLGNAHGHDNVGPIMTAVVAENT